MDQDDKRHKIIKLRYKTILDKLGNKLVDKLKIYLYQIT